MVKKKVSNWGHYPVVEATVKAEVSYPEIAKYVLNNREVIARGNGRCYGGAGLGSSIFSTLKLNKFLDFDREAGIMACEAGVLLSDILEVIVPQGFFLYVTPGTQFITVGGAIASDVHGKNQHLEGCFSDYVLDFSLMDKTGRILKCSKEENTAKFYATVGGMGLTGIILSARLPPI
jgi:FAD/FMN-containing dehydrogenase